MIRYIRLHRNIQLLVCMPNQAAVAGMVTIGITGNLLISVRIATIMEHYDVILRVCLRENTLVQDALQISVEYVARKNIRGAVFI